MVHKEQEVLQNSLLLCIFKCMQKFNKLSYLIGKWFTVNCYQILAISSRVYIYKDIIFARKIPTYVAYLISYTYYSSYYT